jgi:hypothetical protein
MLIPSLSATHLASTIGQSHSTQSSHGASSLNTLASSLGSGSAVGGQSFLSTLQQRWSAASPVHSSSAATAQSSLLKTLQNASGISAQLVPSSTSSHNQAGSLGQSSSAQSPQSWSEATWAHRLQQASGYAGALNLSIASANPSLSVNA